MAAVERCASAPSLECAPWLLVDSGSAAAALLAMVACDWVARMQGAESGHARRAQVISESPFATADGRYCIIRTTEKDPYDPPDDDEGAAR
jgi:hypothetical protein